jgi:REP element-mobilizing transposase RayT
MLNSFAKNIFAMDDAKRVTKEIYFLTTTVVDWVDVFSRPCYKHIIVDSLKYCQKNKGLEIYGWVLMSNHLHMIAGAAEDNKLSDIVRDFKKYTSKAIIEAIKTETESRRKWMLNRFDYAGRNDKKVKNYKFWQDGNDEQLIYLVDYFNQKLNYIHQNPVRAELVDEPHHYLYSSARNYAGENGLLDVIVV